ncbi:MAG: hypothetical protein LBR15_08125 [Methanobrevibacter sp.]|jgi:predicted nuclease with TOPRIM domain|nr:hypothetical protein [Candidatus Methanovirga australis]
MDFNNKDEKDKYLTINLDDNNPKSNFKNSTPETSDFNNLDFIGHDFDENKAEYNNNVINPNNTDESNDYNFEENNHEKPFIDVRIITENLSKVEILSKSIKYLDLKNNFDFIISAIIPVDNLEIVSSTVKGADIVLVTNDYNFDSYNEVLNNPNNKFKEDNELKYKIEADKKVNYYNDKFKNLVGYVGVLKFPKTRNYELIPKNFFQDEIKKVIIKVGLNSLSNMAKLNQIKRKLDLKNKEVNKFSKLNENLSITNNSLINDYEIIKNENYKLKKEIKTLNTQLDDFKTEFSDFKDRFSNIHNKDILEVFQLSKLWEDSFNEVLNHEHHVVLATNNFKPDDIIIGQGLIGAISKVHAVEWLKIIRTSLIFISSSSHLLNDFKNENHNNRHHLNKPTFQENTISNVEDENFKKDDEIFFNLYDNQ